MRTADSLDTSTQETEVVDNKWATAPALFRGDIGNAIHPALRIPIMTDMYDMLSI